MHTHRRIRGQRYLPGRQRRRGRAHGVCVPAGQWPVDALGRVDRRRVGSSTACAGRRPDDGALWHWGLGRPPSWSSEPSIGCRVQRTGEHRQRHSSPRRHDDDLTDGWPAECLPTLDNRYGDFALPAAPIGVETHLFDVGAWTTVGAMVRPTSANLSGARPASTTGRGCGSSGRSRPRCPRAELAEQLAPLEQVRPSPACQRRLVRVSVAPVLLLRANRAAARPAARRSGDRTARPQGGAGGRLPRAGHVDAQRPPGSTYWFWGAVADRRRTQLRLHVGSRTPLTVWVAGQQVHASPGSLRGRYAAWGTRDLRVPAHAVELTLPRRADRLAGTDRDG